MIRRVTYVVFWSLLLTSLWLGVTAPDAEAQPKRAQRCTTNWCILDLPDDPPSTYVMNNQWNNAGAQGSQTITVLGSHSWSTSWDWKRSEEWTVTTYPSAITGWHWGWHFPASHTGLPVAVTPDTTTTVAATFDYRYRPDTTCRKSRPCRYDVAFDLWFHDLPNPDANASPVFELMVWLSYSRADLWIGSTPVLANITVGGFQWNVFQTANTNAVFVPTASQSDVTAASLNLKEFIDTIGEHNLGILSSWYLTSVEFGIEVYKGKGTLDVTSYDVSVVP